jgi:hypothetical protein
MRLEKLILNISKTKTLLHMFLSYFLIGHSVIYSCIANFEKPNLLIMSRKDSFVSIIFEKSYKVPNGCKGVKNLIFEFDENGNFEYECEGGGFVSKSFYFSGDKILGETLHVWLIKDNHLSELNWDDKKKREFRFHYESKKGGTMVGNIINYFKYKMSLPVIYIRKSDSFNIKNYNYPGISNILDVMVFAVNDQGSYSAIKHGVFEDLCAGKNEGLISFFSKKKLYNFVIIIMHDEVKFSDQCCTIESLKIID